jgi:hypothetical protein
MRLDKEIVTGIQFNYPDSAFALVMKDSVWMIGSTIIENSKVDSYLIKLQSKNLYEFADQFSPPGPAKMTVQFQGRGGILGTMQAWKTDDDWVVTSSVQNGVYFKGGATIKDTFPGRAVFVP